MRLTVLGRWSPYPPPDGACPGYLVEAGGRRLLIDCGTGAFSNLQRFTTAFDLDAVVLTHLHPDHVLDIFMLKQSLEWSRYPQVPAPLPLFGPPRTLESLPAWMEEKSREAFRRHFIFSPVDDGMAARIGPYALRFARTMHPIPCFAVRVEAENRVLTYTADTGPSEAVEAVGRGSHLLLAESTLRSYHEEHAVRVGHLTARLAGQMARVSEVDRLLLTHFFTPYGDYTEEAREDAAKEFKRDVLIAKELDSHDI